MEGRPCPCKDENGNLCGLESFIANDFNVSILFKSCHNANTVCYSMKKDYSMFQRWLRDFTEIAINISNS